MRAPSVFLFIFMCLRTSSVVKRQIYRRQTPTLFLRKQHFSIWRKIISAAIKVSHGAQRVANEMLPLCTHLEVYNEKDERTGSRATLRRVGE